MPENITLTPEQILEKFFNGCSFITARFGSEGPQGEKGDKGDTGAQGPKGIDGQASTIESPSFDTLDELLLAYPTGDGEKIHIVKQNNNALYKWNMQIGNWEALGYLGYFPENWAEFKEQVDASFIAQDIVISQKADKITDFTTPVSAENKAATMTELAGIASGEVVKASFWFGKSTLEFVPPVPTEAAQNYFDFTNNTPYNAKVDLTGWDAQTPLDISAGDIIDITAEMWDIPENGYPTKAIFSLAGWGYTPNKSGAPDNITINRRPSDGALQIKDGGVSLTKMQNQGAGNANKPLQIGPTGEVELGGPLPTAAAVGHYASPSNNYTTLTIGAGPIYTAPANGHWRIAWSGVSSAPGADYILMFLYPNATVAAADTSNNGTGAVDRAEMSSPGAGFVPNIRLDASAGQAMKLITTMPGTPIMFRFVKLNGN